MKCSKHPNVDAVDRCAGCAESFCHNCLVEIRGQKYCADCKYMTVDKTKVLEEDLLPCKDADEALKYALFGIFCFGIILGPMAISKASKAKQQIALDPKLTGAGKANAAIVIGIIVVILWVLGIISRGNR